MNKIELQTGSEEWLDKHGIHRFSHEAMATIFELFIGHQDQSYASQAAQAAFSELDRIEQELSRFIENSDISRINNLSKNQSTIVGSEVFECLQACQMIFQDTEGAFDISSGPLVKLWREKNKFNDSELKSRLNNALKYMGLEKLEINPVNHEVTLIVDNIHLDLGGYGKGYALDKMAEILHEWSIYVALLHGGRSSALALAAPQEQEGWPISISDPGNPQIEIKKHYLKFASVSGSGMQKDSHIINPYTGYPIKDRVAAWALTNSAAFSDALSTAFMIMPVTAIEDYISVHPEASGLLLFSGKNKNSEKNLQFGRF